MFSPESVDLFRFLLSRMEISAAEPNLEEVARVVAQAKRELAAYGAEEANTSTV